MEKNGLMRRCFYTYSYSSPREPENASIRSVSEQFFEQVNESEIQQIANSFDFDIPSVAKYELALISIIAKKYERETPLLNDIGGWDGNEYIGSSATRCAEEKINMLLLVRRLAKLGLINNIMPINSSPILNLEKRTSSSMSFSSANNHTALIIKVKTTGRFLILDSWVRDGGEYPIITTPENWINLIKNL